MTRHMITRLAVTVAGVLTLVGSAGAGAGSKVATELAEYAIKRFGGGVAKGAVQTLATKIEAAAVRHGADVFQAVRKVGPRALPLVEQAGAHGKQAARILAQHGEAGAVWVVTRPAAMNLATRHGDRAAAVLVKHAGGVAEPLVGKFGGTAVRALEAVGPQNGRRVAMLAADGHLTKIGRTTEVLEVIAKYGDRAATFVWNNKGALTVAATLTAFLAHPEAFLEGGRDLTKVAGESVVTPVVGSVFGTINVLLGVVALMVVAGAALAWKYGLPRLGLIKASLAAVKGRFTPPASGQ